MILGCVISVQGQACGRFGEQVSDEQFGDDISFSCSCSVGYSFCFGISGLVSDTLNGAVMMRLAGKWGNRDSRP